MSQPFLSPYIAVPKALLRAGMALPADLYLYMPTNQNILLFRKKGVALQDVDLATIHKISDGNLMVLRPDYEEFMKFVRLHSTDAIAADPTSGSAQGVAQSILKTLNGPAPSEHTAQAASQEMKAMLDNAFEFVKEILNKQKGKPSSQSFMEILSRTEENESPLNRHGRHSSALSALALLGLGGASMEELADIAFAGLIHDIGLKDIPRVLMEKHLSGVPIEGLSVPEKLALMRHIDLAFENLKKTRTFVPDGARRIVEQHHENWCGTGFKGITGNSIFRSARVLRIIDDLVTQVQHPDNPQSLKQAFAVLKGSVDLNSGEPLLDPYILESLEKICL